MKLKNKMFLMEKGTCCFGGKSSTSQMANGVVEALQRQLPHSILYLQHFLCYNNQRRNPTEAVVTINITPKTKELGIRLARAINLVMEAYRIPG